MEVLTFFLVYKKYDMKNNLSRSVREKVLKMTLISYKLLTEVDEIYNC